MKLILSSKIKDKHMKHNPISYYRFINYDEINRLTD